MWRCHQYEAVLLVGEGLNNYSCLVPFLGPGATLVLNRHTVPHVEAGQDLGVLIEELLQPAISLGQGYLSPLHPVPARTGPP